MKSFITTKEFRDLNLGFALDEGAPSPFDFYAVFYTERATWQIELTINGQPGHASTIFPNAASVKLTHLLQKFDEYRKTELHRLQSDSKLFYSDVTALNVTKVNGGIQSNVVPHEFKVTIDFRIAPNVDHEEFEKMIRKLVDEVDSEIKLEFEQKQPKRPPTKTGSDVWYWKAMTEVFDEL